MNRTWITLAATCALLLYGCGGAGDSTARKDEAPAAESPSSAPSGPAIKVDEATAATISGKVVFSGEKPVMRPVSMDATPACAREHKEPVMSEEVVVNSNGTLRNAFVWIKAGLPEGRWEMPLGSVTLDQIGCVYKPHVIGVRVGQDLEFLNSDSTNHNIHPLPRVNREWNVSQPPKGSPVIKRFDRQEVMVPIKCNVHPWMKAYAGVVDHPFFAVTGDDGTFVLKGLPPGDYTVEVWQEKYGTQESKVTVGPKEQKTVDFNYKG